MFFFAFRGDALIILKASVTSVNLLDMQGRRGSISQVLVFYIIIPEMVTVTNLRISPDKSGSIP